MSDGSLRYDIAFDVKGLGETARVTRTIKDVEAAARSVRTQRITDLGLAAQGRQAGAAAREVQNLSGAVSNLARLSGLGAIGETVQQLTSLRQAAIGAGGALGFMVAAAGPLAVTAAVARTLNMGLELYGDHLDRITAKTNELATANNKAFAAGMIGLGGEASQEDRQASLKAVEAQMQSLRRQRADPKTSLRSREELDAQMRVMNLQYDRLLDTRLKSEEQKESEAQKRKLARLGKETEQTRIRMGADFGEEQTSARRQERLDLALAQTPGTVQGARQRIELLQERSKEIASGRERMEVNARSSIATPEELSKAQRQLATAMAEEANIRLRVVEEQKTISDLTARAQADLRKSAQQALKSESASVTRRLGEGPSVDSFARAGLFVGGGNAGAESLRWQQASATALGRMLAIMQRQAAVNPAGAVATWGAN